MKIPAVLIASLLLGLASAKESRVATYSSAQSSASATSSTSSSSSTANSGSIAEAGGGSKSNLLARSLGSSVTAAQASSAASASSSSDISVRGGGRGSGSAINKDAFHIKKVLASGHHKFFGAPYLGLSKKEVATALAKAKSSATAISSASASVRNSILSLVKMYVRSSQAALEAAKQSAIATRDANRAYVAAAAKSKIAMQAQNDYQLAIANVETAVAIADAALKKLAENAQKANAVQNTANTDQGRALRGSSATLAAALRAEDDAARAKQFGILGLEATVEALEATKKATNIMQDTATLAANAAVAAADLDSLESSTLSEALITSSLWSKANRDQAISASRVNSLAAQSEAKAHSKASSANAIRHGIVVGLGSGSNAHAQTVAQSLALNRAMQKYVKSGSVASSNAVAGSNASAGSHAQSSSSSGAYGGYEAGGHNGGSSTMATASASASSSASTGSSHRLIDELD